MELEVATVVAASETGVAMMLDCSIELKEIKRKDQDEEKKEKARRGCC